MMKTQQATPTERIKRTLRSLRALADELEAREECWLEAQSIHADCDAIEQQLEALELSAAPACETDVLPTAAAEDRLAA